MRGPSPLSSQGSDATSAIPQRLVAGIPVERIRAQLGKILASEAFSHSERLSRFLRFTVEEAVEGRGAALKEYQVGVEVFDKKGSYDPRIDPIVRVEAGRLRAKLEEFYNTDGRSDPILISLKKGGYVPGFQQRQAPAGFAGQIPARLRALRDRKTIVALALGVLAVVALLWGTAQFRENLSLRRQMAADKLPIERDFSLIWGEFFAPGARNLIVFGSPVFVAAERPGLFLRWSGLTEATAVPGDPHFHEMEQRFGPLSGPRHDYALMCDAVGLHRLTTFFGRAGASLEALPAHSATWETLQDANVIFLGAPRTIPLLRRLPVQQDFDWDADHNVVNRKPQPGEQEKYVTSSHYDEISYAIVASFPGLQSNRRMMLLTAHSAPGTSAAIDHVTQPERARALAQRLGLGEPAGAKQYQLLLRVVVDRGARVKSEYVTHHAASPAPRTP